MLYAPPHEPPPPPGPVSWWDRFTGWTDDDTGTYHQGAALPALQTFTGLANAYLGMKQYGLAKKSYKESKRQFNLNFDTQAKLTDARMYDRQQARNASQPGQHQATSEYMAKWGVSRNG